MSLIVSRTMLICSNPIKLHNSVLEEYIISEGAELMVLNELTIGSDVEWAEIPDKVVVA